MDYGLQLYSVRDMAKKDFEGTLKAVADLGYEFVEPAGFFGHSALISTILRFRVHIHLLRTLRMISRVR